MEPLGQSESSASLEKLLVTIQAWLVVAYAVVVHISITGSWIVLGIGIALWLLAEALEIVEQPRTDSTQEKNALQKKFNLPIIVPPLALPLAVFAFCVTISGVVNGGIDEGLDSFLTLKALLVYFWAYQVFARHLQSRTLAICALLCTGTVTGVWGTIQQLFNFHPGEKFKYLQATGFTGNPMAFAGQMEVTACLALALLLSSTYRLLPGKLSNSVVFGAITACNLAGLFFASERSAWLGMFFAVLLMAAFISRRALAGMALALVVTFIIAWFTVPVVQTRLVPLFTDFQSDISTRVRFSVWQASLDIWQQQPAFGVGIRNFPRLDFPEAIVPGKSLYLVHAHSNFLHILATLGIVGFFGFLYLMGSTLILAIRGWIARTQQPLENLDQTPSVEKGAIKSLDSGIALGVACASISLIVAGFFEYNFGTGNVRLIYWFAVAMIGLRPLESFIPKSRELHAEAVQEPQP